MSGVTPDRVAVSEQVDEELRAGADVDADTELGRGTAVEQMVADLVGSIAGDAAEAVVSPGGGEGDGAPPTES